MIQVLALMERDLVSVSPGTNRALFYAAYDERR